MTLPERGVAIPTVSLGALIRRESAVSGRVDNFGVKEYVGEIAASGFPGIRKMPEALQSALLGSYLSNIVNKDFVEAGYKVRKPAALLAWLQAYGAATATNMSYEKIRILDEVPAWLPGQNFLAVRALGLNAKKTSSRRRRPNRATGPRVVSTRWT